MVRLFSWRAQRVVGSHYLLSVLLFLQYMLVLVRVLDTRFVFRFLHSGVHTDHPRLPDPDPGVLRHVQGYEHANVSAGTLSNTINNMIHHKR